MSKEKAESKPSRRLSPKLVESQAEREAVYRLRRQVLGEAEQGADMLVDAEDEGADLYAVEAEGKIIASIRQCRGGVVDFPPRWREIYRLDKLGEAIPLARVCVSDRLVVDPQWRDSKALGLLLAMAYRAARTHGIWIDFTHCAPGLIALYEQLGYRRYAEAFVDPEAGNRVPLLLLTEDLRHLQVVRSPLLALSRAYESAKKHPEQASEAEQASRVAQDWFRATFPEHASYINRRALRGSTFWRLLADRLAEPPSEAIPLFRGLDPNQIQRFLESGSVMSFKAGQTVVRPGERGEEMFIILSGLAEVFAHSGAEGDDTSGKVSVNLLGKGEEFGEVGLIGEHERSAEVVARSDLELLVISRHSLRRAMKSDPAMMCTVLYNLSMILCDRLRLSTQNWMESIGAEGELGSD
jgi:hypothetical protein